MMLFWKSSEYHFSVKPPHLALVRLALKDRTINVMKMCIRDSSTSYTIAGVLSNYAGISNLEMALGDFLTDENNTYKEKVCVLGSNVAKTVFGSVYDAYDGTVYIDNRPYQVSGIISEMGTVAVSYTHLSIPWMQDKLVREGKVWYNVRNEQVGISVFRRRSAA